MLVAKILKCKDRTFIKALSVFGATGLLGGLIYLITLLKLPDFISILLVLGEIVFVFFFLIKIYSISILRTLSLLLLDILFMLVITLILFFTVGFSFLFSLMNSLNTQNTMNDTNIIQQVYPTQDQTQQNIQNTESQIINTTPAQTPQNNTSSSSTYTNSTYGYSLKYPLGWKLNDIYPNSVKIALGDSFPPEELEIYVSVGIYNEASIESSLKYENTPYQKKR